MGILESLGIRDKEKAELDPTDIAKMLNALQTSLQRTRVIQTNAKELTKQNLTYELGEDATLGIHKMGIIQAGMSTVLRQEKERLMTSDEVKKCVGRLVTIRSVAQGESAGKGYVEDGSQGLARDFAEGEVITGVIGSVESRYSGTIELRDARTSSNPEWHQSPFSSFSVSHVFFAANQRSEFVPTVQIEPGS